VTGFDGIAERTLAARAKDGAYRLEDPRLMFVRDAKKDGFP
jgi:hypothetical protein